LEEALKGSAELPVLAMLTYRPEFDAPWIGETNVANLVLNRLGAEQTEMLAADLASEQLDRSTLQEIVNRADGIPLFAEELTRNLLEAQGDGEDVANIPATLQDILAARLDRTGDARETAQVGAIIGRDFSFELLQASKIIPQSRLAGDLLTLEASGLISRRGQAVDAVYTFKHALIQDAAYESLLRRRRQGLHRRIAETIIELFPDRAEQAPQVLAQHFEAAGEAITAAHYWFDAGKQSVRLGADGAGLVHYQQDIELIENLSNAEEHAEFNLDCHIALSAAATFAYNSNDPRKMEINQRAAELCEIVDDDQRTFKVTWGRWYLEHFAGNDPVAAVETAKQLLAIGQRQNDRGFLLQGHHSAWTSTWSKEDLRATMEHAEAGIRLYDVHEHRHHYVEFGGHDPGMCARNIGAMVRGFMGQLDTGQELSNDAVKLGLQVDHVPSELMARGFGTTLLMFRREVDPLYAWIDDLEQLAGHIEGPFDLFVATPRLIKGWTQATNGQLDVGIAAIEKNLEMIKKSGFPKIGFQLMLLADAKRIAGEFDEALELLVKAKENGLQMNEQIWLSEIARVQGNILVAMDEHDGAAREFANALEISSRQGALLLELRAARDLATLWHQQGRTEDAYGLVRPLYDQINEGHDTPDLLETKALLDELT
jgi:tetratricopeptide (TPR) repeat protein